MKAEQLVENNAIGTRDLPYVVNQDGEEQKVVFKEIALTAVNMARLEMKEKAIEAFRDFVKDYCEEAGHYNISKNAEHYIEVFKNKLEEKQ